MVAVLDRRASAGTPTGSRGGGEDRSHAPRRRRSAGASPQSCTERLPEVTPSLGLAAVWRDHADAASVDVELVGGDLRQRGQDALADLDLAGGDLDAAVRRETRSHLRQPRVGAQAPGHGPGHRLGAALSGDAFAARSTARTMRLCAPQRHRLRRAPRAPPPRSDRVCARSAAALIRMPETQ